MTAVSYHVRENRLGKMLAKPGGISGAKAVAQAEQGLQKISGEIIAEIDRNLALIERSALRANTDLAARREVYAHAYAITGLSGSCGLAEVGKAAFNLCELIDVYSAIGSWGVDAIAVHLSAMALLRAPSAEDQVDLRQSILGGLKQMLDQASALDGAKQGAAC